jgi:peptidoglycan/LPS O-acetylase OafA/YrhL
MARTSPAPRRLGHVAALDGIRGIAVLLVVISHLNLLVPRQDITGIGLVDGIIEGGYLGVDVFFVLSGFLITALLLNEERGRGSVGFGAFYARRAIRLLPALYFLLLCHAAYTLITELDWSAEVASIRAALLYYSNWQIVYDLESVATGTNHLWSLAVEEQFYLVWPVLLVGFLGLRYRASTVSAVLGLAILAIAVRRALLWEDGTPWLELFVRTDTRADALLVGALLASLWVRGVTPVRWVNPVAWAALALAFVYIATVEPDSGFSFEGGSTVFAVLVASLLLAVLNGTWAPARWLAAAPLTAVGLVSYGLYLWHFPVFHVVARYGEDLPEVVRVIVGLAVAAGMTLLSWFLLEKPMQGLRTRFTNRERQPATVG